MNHFEKKEAVSKGNYFAFHFNMQKHIRELYPTWIDQLDNQKHVSGFTDDFDGLLCSAFARHYLGLEVNAFYNFKQMMKIDPTESREMIFFDSALTEGKVFDNHLTRSDEFSPYNIQSANINNVTGVHLDTYTDKFAMSTLIQLYAIYNVPLPSTLQGKMILLCVDVGFKGFYDPRYKRRFLSYLEMFNMLELVDILDAYSCDEMYEFMLMAQMNAKIINLSDGTLFIERDNRNSKPSKWINFDTGMDLHWYSEHLGYLVELPKASFEVVETFKTQTVDSHDFTPQMKSQAFSYAFINKSKVMISLKKEN